MSDTAVTTPEQQRERVGRLVTALENWPNEQGHGQLREVSPYTSKVSDCCLGVACEVYRRETGDGFWDGAESVQYPPFVTGSEGAPLSRGEARGDTLPGVVASWYGFTYEDGSPENSPRIDIDHPEYGKTVSAIVANDSARLSFREIADGFRRRYLS